jgi:hypothetical protein
MSVLRGLPIQRRQRCCHSVMAVGLNDEGEGGGEIDGGVGGGFALE